MNNKILDNALRINKDLIVPNYMIKYYSKLNLDGLSFVFMIYLINCKENVTFDINKIAKDIYASSNEVLELINELNEKNYISIEMRKNNGVIEEYISTELFYNKINSFILDETKAKDDGNIYTIFEEEFGRTLSPTECETISNWSKNNISDELIKAALKEAVLSGVSNLRYIDKILFEWNKKGYKKPSDIKKKRSKDETIDLEEIYDYDWINE